MRLRQQRRGRGIHRRLTLSHRRRRRRRRLRPEVPRGGVRVVLRDEVHERPDHMAGGGTVQLPVPSTYQHQS